MDIKVPKNFSVCVCVCVCVCGRWSLLSALHTLLVVLTSVIHLLSGQRGSRPPRSPTTFRSIIRHSSRVLKMHKCVLIVNEYTDWKWHVHFGHTGENINVWFQQIQQTLSLRPFGQMYPSSNQDIWMCSHNSGSSSTILHCQQSMNCLRSHPYWGGTNKPALTITMILKNATMLSC